MFQQQDAAEILNYSFDELCRESPHIMDMINHSVKNEVMCHGCFGKSVKEEPSRVLQLQVSKTIQDSINNFLLLLATIHENTKPN